MSLNNVRVPGVVAQERDGYGLDLFAHKVSSSSSWGYSYVNTDGTGWTPLGSRDAAGNYIIEPDGPLTAEQLQEAIEAHEPHLGPRCS